MHMIRMGSVARVVGFSVMAALWSPLHAQEIRPVPEAQ